MKKKDKIIGLSIVLVILIILLIIESVPSKKMEEENNNRYTCTSVQDVADVKIGTTYYVYFNDDNIEKIDINKYYKGNSEKAKSNIFNYRYIIGVETKQNEEKKGFSAKVNKDSKIEYNFTYTFDVLKVDDELASMYGIYKTVLEQNKYLEENGYVCE